MAELLQAVALLHYAIVLSAIPNEKNPSKLTKPTLSCLVQGLVLGCLPDSQAESNLVDEVGKVVDEVQAAVIDTAHEVAKEVTSRIDGPACSDDEAHGAERRL